VSTPSTQSVPDLPPPPALCKLAVGLLGILIALSALPWIYFSLSKFGGFAWGLFGFELLTALAGVFAILLALGKYKQGWAIGITAIAGAILVALVFGLYIDFWMARKTDFPDVYTLAKYTLAGRAAIVAALFALASIAVFTRNIQSLSYIVKAVLCAIPVVIVAGLMKYNIGPGNWINSTLNPTGGNGAASAVLVISLGLLFIVLISAAGHLLIRAYECGRPHQQQPQPSE
jgi:hypothetical protein